MSKPSGAYENDPYEDVVGKIFTLQSLLKVLSLAIDGEQIAGRTFEQSGGGTTIDMAVDMAGEIYDEIETLAHIARKSGVGA